MVNTINPSLTPLPGSYINRQCLVMSLCQCAPRCLEKICIGQVCTFFPFFCLPHECQKPSTDQCQRSLIFHLSHQAARGCEQTDK